MQIKNIILAFAFTLITADARPTHYDQTTDNSGAPLPNGNSGSDGQNAGHNSGLYNFNNPRQNPDHNGDKVDDCDKDTNYQPSSQLPVQHPRPPPKDGGNNGVDSIGKVPSQKPTPPTSPDHRHDGGYGDKAVPPVYLQKNGRNGGNGQPPNDSDDSMGKGPNQKPSPPTSPDNYVPPTNPPKDVANGGNGQPPNNSVDSMGKGPNKKPSPPGSRYPGHGGDNHSKVCSGLDDDCESTETPPPHTTPSGNSDPSKPLPGHNFTDPSNKPPTTTQGY